MTKEMSASHCRDDHIDIRNFLAPQGLPASGFPITLANFRSKKSNENPALHELKDFSRDKTVSNLAGGAEAHLVIACLPEVKEICSLLQISFLLDGVSWPENHAGPRPVDRSAKRRLLSLNDFMTVRVWSHEPA
jgi:hypothetical protein